MANLIGTHRDLAGLIDLTQRGHVTPHGTRYPAGSSRRRDQRPPSRPDPRPGHPHPGVTTPSRSRCHASGRVWVSSAALATDSTQGAAGGLIPEPMRGTFEFNAPTFHDGQADPHWSSIELSELADMGTPLHLTYSSGTRPAMREIVEILARRLPTGRQQSVGGAGRVPQVTDPRQLAKLIEDFRATLGDAAARPAGALLADRVLAAPRGGGGLLAVRGPCAVTTVRSART